MVDTLGFIWKVFVGAANSGDREGLAALAMSMMLRMPRLKKILVDQGYTGPTGEAIKKVCGWEVEVSKPEFVPEFNPQRGQDVGLSNARLAGCCMSDD